MCVGSRLKTVVFDTGPLSTEGAGVPMTLAAGSPCQTRTEPLSEKLRHKLMNTVGLPFLFWFHAEEGAKPRQHMTKRILVWYREGKTTALQPGRFGKVYGHDGGITQTETQESNTEVEKK